jgi:hypothetical protein
MEEAMIKLVITNYPSTHSPEFREGARVMLTDQGMSSCVTETVISESGLSGTFDWDVYAVLGGWRVRIPQLCSEDVHWDVIVDRIEASGEDMSGEWEAVLR